MLGTGKSGVPLRFFWRRLFAPRFRIERRHTSDYYVPSSTLSGRDPRMRGGAGWT
jgi:hypothetical protein